MRRRILGAALLATATALTACGWAPQQKPAQPTVEIRRDAAPVERRFPQLGRLDGVTWALWLPSSADSRMPGPTDYAVSGVARLSEADTRRLGEQYTWAAADDGPSLHDEVAGEVPQGVAWQSSDTFEQDVTGGLYEASFHFDPDGRVMLFAATNPAVAEPSPSYTSG